jgi:hypothetical protein
MTETEQTIKIIEAVSGLSTINVISLSMAGVAILLTLYQLLYKPNSLKATVSQITSEENDYIIPITFINSGYQSNAIIHVTNNAFYENPISKPNCEGLLLYQLDAFTLKPGDVATKFLRVNHERITQDDHSKNYKPDRNLPSLKTFLGIKFSIVTKNGKRINTEYLTGYHDTEIKDRAYSSKGCYSIGDTSINLLKDLDFANNKPVPIDCFTERK